MFAKSAVRGSDANPLFKDLGRPDRPAARVENFQQVPVARDGRVVAHYSSRVTPQDKALVRQIEQLLAAP